jgi:hypothetical protein
MINTNKLLVKQSFQPLSLSRGSDSSSGIDIIDEESMEIESSESEPLVIRYHSSPSSPPSRQVIFKSTDQTKTFSNKPRRRRESEMRRERRKRFFHKSQDSSHLSNRKHQQCEHKDDRLKRLYDAYSSEHVHQDWKPLTLSDSQELYQYAFDRYHRKSFLN